MYPVGLLSSLHLLVSSFGPWTLAYSCISLAVLVCVSLRAREPEHEHAPVTLPGLRIFSILPFFARRHDFLNHGFSLTRQKLFQFKLLLNPVLVVSGEKGRKDFFNAKGLDLQEGFRVLSGALPFVQGVTSDLRQRRIAQIYKRLAAVQQYDRLSALLRPILDDCRHIMLLWAHSGAFDPFETVYGIVFQTTIRALTCAEIANDPAVVFRLRKLYDQVDRGTTPATVIFPWFPSPSMLSKAWATKQIYDIVSATVKLRKESSVVHNDSLQMLLDAGEEPAMIVGFIMGLVIAGARSTGTTASWMITFLGCHPTWRQKALEEIDSLLAAHSTHVSPHHSPYASTNHPPYASEADPLTFARHTPSFKYDPTTACTALSSIPLTGWENETPVLDALVRETLRIAQPHVAMRRNVGPEVYIDGKALPTGAFAIYPFSDVHLDERLYEDPWKFDPGRTETKGDFNYIGWGGGRINCLGKRLATIEIKLITAMVVLNFDFTTIDATGRAADPHPRPNWNDVLSCRPTNGSFSVKYTRVVNPAL